MVSHPRVAASPTGHRDARHSPVVVVVAVTSHGVGVRKGGVGAGCYKSGVDTSAYIVPLTVVYAMPPNRIRNIGGFPSQPGTTSVLIFPV